MSIAAFRRLIETFFRHWLLYVMVFVVVVAAGVSQVRGKVDLYTSTSAMVVDGDPLIGDQVGVDLGAGGFGFYSPAQLTSQEIYGLVATQSYMESVAERAGLELDADPRVRSGQIQDLRRGVAAFPNSNNIVQVNVTTADPDLSARANQALIDEFLDFRVQSALDESGTSEEFFTDLVAQYKVELDGARDAVDEALAAADALQLEPGEEIPSERQVQIDRLQDEELEAGARYQGALTELQRSQLAAQQLETNIRQTYAVIDQPDAPVAANGSLFNDLMDLAMYAVVGLVLALVIPIIVALTDRSVVFADDLPLDADDRLVAVVSKVRKKRLRLTDLTVTPQPAPQLGTPIGPAPVMAQLAMPASATQAPWINGTVAPAPVETPPATMPPAGTPPQTTHPGSGELATAWGGATPWSPTERDGNGHEGTPATAPPPTAGEGTPDNPGGAFTVRSSPATPAPPRIGLDAFEDLYDEDEVTGISSGKGKGSGRA